MARSCGTGRQNISWAVARLASAQRPLASRPAVKRIEPGVGAAHGLAHDLEVFDLTAPEEGVVYGHQRREVLVDRGGLHAEAAGHLGQAEAVDPFLGHHVRGDVEDLLDGLLAPSGAPVDPLRCRNLHRSFVLAHPR